MSWAEQYQNWGTSTFGRKIPIFLTEVMGVTSIGPDTKKIKHWYKVWEALLGVEHDIVGELLEQIKNENIPGEIAEFGIFRGTWINKLYEIEQNIGLSREIWGFDSFQGLSKPNPTFDSDFWKEGAYACSLEEVRLNTKADERSSIKFIEGFFADSLVRLDAQKLEQVCFARIDCDIYEPTVDCLKFLGSRLSHGSVLVFDDWTYNIGSGETKAFAEWVPTVPNLEFEHFFSGAWGHFYVRVWHKGRSRYLFEV